MNESVELKDEILVCCDCGNEFIFYKGEQEFFKLREKEMKEQNPSAIFKIPKRCKICRKKYKAERAKLISVQLQEKERLEANRPDLEKWKQQITDLKVNPSSKSTQSKTDTISSQSIVSEFVNVNIIDI